MAEKNSSSLGVSIHDIPNRTLKNSSEKTNAKESEISAYVHDTRRSVLIGVIAIVVELVLYFSGAIDKILAQLFR